MNEFKTLTRGDSANLPLVANLPSLGHLETARKVTPDRWEPRMSRQRVALLFVLYFIVSVAIPVVIVAFAMPSEVSISRMTSLIGAAIELGIKIYFLSGVLPFAGGVHAALKRLTPEACSYRGPSLFFWRFLGP